MGECSESSVATLSCSRQGWAESELGPPRGYNTVPFPLSRQASAAGNVLFLIALGICSSLKFPSPARPGWSSSGTPEPPWPGGFCCEQLPALWRVEGTG